MPVFLIHISRVYHGKGFSEDYKLPADRQLALLSLDHQNYTMWLSLRQLVYYQTPYYANRSTAWSV